MPHWQKWAKNHYQQNHFFLQIKKTEIDFFSQKNNFRSYGPPRKISIIADNGYSALGRPRVNNSAQAEIIF